MPRKPDARTTIKPLLAAVFPWLFTTAYAQAARACPDCAIGRAARTQVWSEDLALNLFVALLPFAAMIVASIWADRIGRSNPR